MHVLLPPSETKRTGGNVAFDVPVLSHNVELATARSHVRSALDVLMQDLPSAAAALKLGVRSHSELQHNLNLDSGELLPAIERYTGVLFDALEAETLTDAARSWVEAHVSVQSALFGLVGAASRIPAYRLSAGTRLPALEIPLKKTWSQAHESIDWAKFGWVLDLRSKDYAALAPVPHGRGVFVEVQQRDVTGKVKSLNHFNKAAKGRLVRRLAEMQPVVTNVSGFQQWAVTSGLESQLTADGSVLSLIFPSEK